MQSIAIQDIQRIILASLMLATMCLFSQIAIAGGGEDSSKGSSQSELKSDYGAFIRLEPLMLPIIDSNGISQTVTLLIVIEASSEKHRETIRLLTPRLKDAYLQEMYNILTERRALRAGMVDVVMVKQKLINISTRILGEDIVNDVLLESVSQRPI